MDTLKKIACLMEHFKFFRKTMLTLWMIMLYTVIRWFMDLETPSTQQVTFISTVCGVTPAVLAAYSFSPKHSMKE